MPGPVLFCRPRRSRRGAALTLVFAGVLTAGAAGGSWTVQPPGQRVELRPGHQPGHQSAAQPGHRPGQWGERRAMAAGGSAGSVPSVVDSARRAGGPTVHTSEDAATLRDEVAGAAALAQADGASGTEAATETVSRSGDRWGAVYGPEAFAVYERSLAGEYTGVGLWIERASDGGITVSRVRDGGPADKAGIRAGDRLRSVAGHRAKGRPVTETVALLRGAGPATAGSRVGLVLVRGHQVRHATLRRTTIAEDPVTVHPLGEDDVRIKVTAFTKGSGAQVRAAVSHAPPGAGVLLDLRGNAGGLVTEATTAAAAFLDGGLVATYDVRGSERSLHAERGGDDHRPVVALVDSGTMSAAELLTGALQDRGRAVVVGTRTFGKGSVQLPSRLPDGSVAELTVGHYSTPAGRRLDGKGITPDLEAPVAAQARARTVLSGLGHPS
ncbi:S41 family peptidase [Streptomyces tsukubensis]|uniref:S41 family peptidase n=1 Tax=Streptomyces tsukubensis TaxID=83656 RepID=UPI00098FF41A